MRSRSTNSPRARPTRVSCARARLIDGDEDNPAVRESERMRSGWIVLAALVATRQASSKVVDRPVAASFDDPCIDGDATACKRRALDAFRTALAAQRAGKAAHPLRVSYFGDSLTADDH